MNHDTKRKPASGLVTRPGHAACTGRTRLFAHEARYARAG
jgi:hypothetical protein